MNQGIPPSHGAPDFQGVKPKPKFFDKRFWIGLGLGAAAGFLVLNGALVVFMLIMHAASMRSHATNGATGAAALPAPPLPGTEKADYHMHLEGMDGTLFHADSLKGKVLFLNFWATWCSPCRSEMPAIQHLYDKVKDPNVVFLAISDEKRETIAQFLKQNPYTFPVCRIVGEPPEVFRTAVIPATFIVAPDGHIAFKHIGSAQWDDGATLAFLKSLSPSPQ